MYLDEYQLLQRLGEKKCLNPLIIIIIIIIIIIVIIVIIIVIIVIIIVIIVIIIVITMILLIIIITSLYWVLNRYKLKSCFQLGPYPSQDLIILIMY